MKMLSNCFLVFLQTDKPARKRREGKRKENWPWCANTKSEVCGKDRQKSNSGSLNLCLCFESKQMNGLHFYTHFGFNCNTHWLIFHSSFPYFFSDLELTHKRGKGLVQIVYRCHGLNKKRIWYVYDTVFSENSDGILSNFLALKNFSVCVYSLSGDVILSYDY